MKQYVIIGGDAAGMSAAMELVRSRDSEQTKITTLEKGSIYSYAQCGLPYVIEGAVTSADDLIARDVETFRKKHGIDARTNTEVTHVDCNNKLVYIKDDQGEQQLSFDTLLISTGAKAVTPKIPGNDLRRVHTLKTIPDLELIQEDLASVQHVTLIGGGYIGLELAEALVTKGFDVRIIERNPQLAKVFDQEMAALLHEEAVEQGIDVVYNTNVQKLGGENGVVTSVKTENDSLATDLVIFATGISPNTAFLENCGIKRFENGAVCVNEYLETNVKGIYAAGDCTVQYHRVKKEYDYVPLGTNANKQGRIAGMNMSEQHPLRSYKGMVGTGIFRFFRLSAAITGLNEKTAKERGLDPASITYTGTHIAGYFEDKKRIDVKLVYDKKTDQLYGAQVIGEGADKRIDVAATALYQGLTCEDIVDLDLSYAPPYNGVWDPLQQAARRRKRY